MRKILLLLGVLMFLSAPVLACEIEGVVEAPESPDKGIARCPFTQMTDQKQCLDCHEPITFKLKEASQHAGRNYPNTNTKVFDGVGYYFLEAVSADLVKEALDYFKHHNIKHIVIDIQSPGGALFEAWRIIGLLGEWEKNGGIVETRSYGFAASAGFMILVAGTNRYVSKTAECMWHELMKGDFLKITTPSDSEDEARVLRHLQDTVQNWLVSRSNMSKEDLDKMVHKKELWLNGSQMVKHGFADGFLD